MAVDVQKEYNRLRAERDAIYRIGNLDRKASVRLLEIDKALKALKPKLIQGPAIYPRVPSASQIASRLDYSTDPNSDFQKALTRVKSEADAKAVEDAKKKKIADLEASYVSDKKATEASTKAAKKVTDDARKVAEDTTKLAQENAIRIAAGKPPIVPKTSAVLPKGVDVAQYFKKVTDTNIGSVYMGTIPAIGPGTPGSSGVAKRVLSQDAVAMFVNDPKLEAKVIQSMKSNRVQDVSRWAAYAQWQSYVKIAETAYRSGLGVPVTPMDVLNDALRKGNVASAAANASKTTTQKYTTEFKPDVAGALIDSIFQNTLGMNPTQAQRSKYLAEFKAMSDKGSVTTTTSSGGNSSSVTKGGVSQEDMAAGLTKKIKASPEFSTDLKERQALDFNSAINKLMSRSI